MNRLGVVLVILLLGACDTVYGLTRPDVGSQRTILVTQDSSETLVDFPVSIVIDDPHLAENARADGRDIHFENAAGEPLAFEMVAYDAGHLDAWVRATLGRRTEITMIYGGDPVVADPTEAWSGLFASVWHLDGDGLEERDSTGTDNDVTPPGVRPAPAAVSGKIGGAREYHDTSVSDDKHALCGTNAHLLAPPSSFALSLWVKAGPPVGQWSVPFEAGGFNTSVGGIAVELDDNGEDKWNAILTGDTDVHDEVPIALAAYDIWTYFTVVVDRTSGFMLRLYANGAFVTEKNYNFMSLASEMPTCLGGGNGYEGVLDEVRIYTDNLTPAWIDAEWDNIDDRDSFVQLLELGE